MEILVRFIKIMKKKRSLENKTDKIDALELSLANTLIYYYAKLKDYNSINAFIMIYDSGVVSKKIFGSFYSYLLMLIGDEPKANKVLINVYGIR